MHRPSLLTRTVRSEASHRKGRNHQPWVIGVVVLAVATAVAVSAATAIAADPDEWTPVPFRVRNLTFPTLLVMGFKPGVVVPLEPGSWVVELDTAISNNFQMSDGVENVLERRGGPRRPIGQAEVDAIIASADDIEFLVDGEFTVVDLGVHYGLTPTLDLSLHVSHLSYGGGILDPLVWDFHNAIGFSQAGRQLVSDDHFQVLLADAHDALLLLDRPTSGGFTDPMIGLRWTPPHRVGSWRFALEAGAKLPLADETKWLSTGSLDFGAQLTAQRQWRRDAVVLNMALVAPGEFEPSAQFEPPKLPSIDVAWVHRIGPTTTSVVQVLFSENIFREVTDSDLAKAEFQATAGFTWEVAGGRLGFAVTENMFNYDNTPDIAVHLSYGRLFGQRSRRQ